MAGKSTAFLMISVGVLLVSGLTPSVAAQDDGHDHDHGEDLPALTIAGLDGEDCPEGTTYCFEVVEGSLEALSPDTSVQITFENRGEQVHNLAITRQANTDPEHKNTSPGERIAGSADEIQPGESETFIFHVPANADGLYLWCHVPGHEQLGMWLEVAFDETGEALEDNGDPTGEAEEEEGHHHAVARTYAFGSTVEASDNDFGWPSHSAGTGDLCLLDDNGDGDYDPGEPLYLFATAAHGHNGDDDHDDEECGKVPGNAVRLLPPYEFAPGSLVRASDADFGKPTSEIHSHPGYFDSDGDGEFEQPDTTYLDLDGSGSITVGDLRLTPRGDLAAGTVVASGDADVTNPLAALRGNAHLSFHDDDVIFEGGDKHQWYLNVEGEHAAVAHNDVRLTNNIPDTSGVGDEAAGDLSERVDSMGEEREGEMAKLDGQVDSLSQDMGLLRTGLSTNASELHEVLQRLDELEQRLDALTQQLAEAGVDLEASGSSAVSGDDAGDEQREANATPTLALPLVAAALVSAGLLASRWRGAGRR